MPHLGDFALETTFDFKYTTRAADGTPTDAASDTVVVYEDNSTTEITTAETLTQPFDSRTGLANLRVACTAANGFETNKSYAAVYSAGTVDGVSVVGEVICTWTIEKGYGLTNAALANMQNFFDGTGYVGGTAKLEVDVQEVDGSAAAAANLNSACDNYSATRGLTGTALPAVVAGSAGGVPTDTDGNGAVRIVDGTGARELNTSSGTVTVGTNNDKTGYTASTVSDKTGYSLAADQSSVTVGTVNTVGDKTGYSLSATGLDAITQAATGMVEIAKAVWDRVLSGANHNISQSAGRRLRELQEGGSYADGAVWLDTVNGTAGTDNFVNGVEVNPVDTLADALTIAASVGLKKIRIAAGSSVTVNSGIDGYVLEGRNYTLVFGTGSTIGATVIGASSLSGVMRGIGTTQYVIDCLIDGDLTAQAGTHIVTCGIGADILADEAGDYFLDRCHSAIAGNNTWTFDFGVGSPVGNVNLNVRNYSGGIRLRHMGDSGTDTASIEGQGNIIEDACSGGTVSCRGNFTTSGITNITMTETARIDTAQIKSQAVAALNTDTYAEPGQGKPGATISLAQKIGYVYKSWRNGGTSSASLLEIKNDGDTVVDHKLTHSSDGTTYTRGEMESGP